MVFIKNSSEFNKNVVEVDKSEYDVIENYKILVRFRPGLNVGWIKALDVEPPMDLVTALFFENSKEAEEELREWFKEEYGGGIWRIELQDESGRIVKSKQYKIADADITYGVAKWVVYVKGEKSGKWYKADTEFASMPTPTELIEAVGGGGKIRLAGYDEKGRVISTKILELNAPPPDWLIEKENSVEKQIIQTIQEKMKEEQQKLIENLIGSKNDQNPVDQLIDELKKLVENKKLETLNSILTSLKGAEKPDGKKGIAEVLFVDPYKAKIDSMNLLIKKLAEKGDVETAVQLLNSIPDGTGALINLLNAGAVLAEAVALTLTGASNSQILRRLTKAQEQPKINKPENKNQERMDKSTNRETTPNTDAPCSDCPKSTAIVTEEPKKDITIVEEKTDDGWSIDLEFGGDEK
ncbi:MAG: hypothetical protein QW540_08205 [Archaeoglobaceae archaeon]